MRRHLPVLLIVFLLGLPTAAQGFIVPPPGVDTDPATLHIDYHRVNIDIANQIATTRVQMQFTNNGPRLAEGTFIFPLPQGAAVERLTMTVDDLEIDAQILPADEARAIYNEIVRQYRDPALLEYVGSDVIQASVFPIPPGESRKIEIVYGQVLELDNGLLNYTYPMNTAGSGVRRVDQFSIGVNVQSDQPISNVYSPSHNVALDRPDDNTFSAGFEATNYAPTSDYSLFYGIQRESIDINLLTYRESADQDGFFMLMVQPPLTVPAEDILPKDVVIVLDQSGSMQGSKWQQAQSAANYVLDNLNPQDRFNVVLFSTGSRIWADALASVEQAADAQNWINNAFPEGGTNIYEALSTAVNFADDNNNGEGRALTVLFMTDGLATEGIIETPTILAELNNQTPDNVRVFAFGVGDDVDTFLLDALVRDFRGDSSYVRPTERIDEEVASLYNKISVPVLRDIMLSFSDNVITELLYPPTMPDLFASEQVTIVGRYRQGAAGANISMRGNLQGERIQLDYPNLAFRDAPGGEAFIARLWATRRIGDLLNTIRLNGESQELVDSIVSLSIRYGIITPYTSFLIEEDDILTERGRQQAVNSTRREAEELAQQSSGASAVDAADAARNLQSASAPLAMPTQAASRLAPTQPNAVRSIGGAAAEPDKAAPEAFGEMEADDEATFADFDDADGNGAGAGSNVPANPVQNVGEKTFIWQNGVWTDTTYEPDTMQSTQVLFLSDDYFDLLDVYAQAGEYFALGQRVIVVLDDTAYEVVPENVDE